MHYRKVNMEMVNNLDVINASAGSGKTTLLVKKFLILLLQNKENSNYNSKEKYKNILAVTFTNKAAAEMKDRIIESLTNLTDINKNKDSDIVKYHLKEIKSIVKLNNDEIEKRAQRCLTNILHDYSNFSISTIDSFSYKIIRSFAYYLGVSDSFEPYLDFNSLIEKAIDNLFLKLGNDKLLTKFLLNNYGNYLNDNEKNINSLQNSLLEIGLLLGNESISENLRKNYIQNNNISNISQNSKSNKKNKKDNNNDDEYENNILKHLNDIINDLTKKIKILENSLKQNTSNALNLINEKNLDITDFKYGKSSGVYIKLLKFQANNFNLKNLTYTKSIEALIGDYKEEPNNESYKNYDEWLNISPSKICDIENFASELCQLVTDIYKTKDILAEYNIIYSNLYPLALLSKIEQEINVIKEKENILPIGEFNSKISEIVSESHAPFIYERIGNRYENIMIDEFQDTSTLQWGNLKPLVDNSMAQGFYNLIVGDSKQAIYRWRDGDVNQFIDLQKKYNSTNVSNSDNNISSAVGNSTNYRSLFNVIEFNNQFFTYAGNGLNKEYQDNVYSKNLIYQQIPEKPQKGYVNIKFINKKDYKESTCRTVYNTIVNLVENKKYSYSDIAIIVRTANNGREIANYIMEKDNSIKIISADSLLLKSSEQIKTLVSFLKIIGTLSDKKDLYNVISFIGNNKNINFNTFIYNDISSKQNKTDENNSNLSYKHVIILSNFFKENNIDFDIKNTNVLSPLEICYNAIEKLELEIDIYVQSFLNIIQQNNNLSLTDLINLIEDELETSSVTLGKSENALQIITIHKAKGLEFPIVIFPYADFSSSGRGKTKMLFVENKIESLKKELPYVLIKHSSALEDTIFNEDYQKEKDEEELDNTNLYYVACTRAKEKLFILGKEAKEDKKNSSLNRKLLTFCKDNVSNNNFKINEIKRSNNIINPDSYEDNIEDIYLEYEIGNLEAKEVNKNDDDKKPISNIDFDLKKYANNWRNRLCVASSTEHLILIEDIEKYFGKDISKYFKKYSKGKKLISPTDNTLYGNQLHDILAKIKTKEDLDYYIDNLDKEVNISDKNKEKIKDTLFNIKDNKKLCSTLFDYKKVYIEKDLCDKDGVLFRADRIVVKDDLTLVVDYKTGKKNDKTDKKYQEQINNYCNILKQVGFENVKGEIIYL